jgi:hypothetical protein
LIVLNVAGILEILANARFNVAQSLNLAILLCTQ